MFRRLGDSMRRFMYGRYGSDRLNMVLVFGGLLLSIVSSFSDSLAILSVLTYVPLFWAIFRMFSKNIAARQREAAAFNRFTKYFTDRHNRYFASPSCSQTVRVPRRKGRISIKCPRCGQRFEKKT